VTQYFDLRSSLVLSATFVYVYMCVFCQMFACLSLPSFCEIVPEGLSSPSGIFVMKSYNREYIFLF